MAQKPQAPEPRFQEPPVAREPARAAMVSAGAASGRDLQQRFGFARLQVNTVGKRIAASDHAEAKRLVAGAREKLDQAQQAVNAGDSDKASALIAAVMQELHSANQLVPSEAMREEQRRRYDNHRKALNTAVNTHRVNLEKAVAAQGPTAGARYDETELARLDQEAITLAGQQHYEDAIARLEQAQRLVNGAIHRMLNDTVVIVKLDLETPEKEWAYEERRYRGYEELLPVAVEVKIPNAGQKMLMERTAEQARAMAEKARAKAAARDYPVAIRMITDATEEIRKALRVVGVDQ